MTKPSNLQNQDQEWQNVASSERDARVMEIYERLLEIEQRLIPTGLHVFGRPSAPENRADMLRMIASFDRSEAGARALPDLVCESLKLGDYGSLQKAEAPEQQSARERVDHIVAQAVSEFVSRGTVAAVDWLTANAGVAADESRPMFQLLERISQQLATNQE